MQDFMDLKVWQRSHALVLRLYKLTSSFPKSELYGLADQIRRAGASIPANIAEGCGRGGNVELARYLQIAIGSMSELQYHILLAKDLGYVSESDYDVIDAEIKEIRRMLTGLIASIRRSSVKRPGTDN